MIRDFFKWTQFSIIQQSLVISVQNVSPPATAFVSSGHCIRLLQLSHSSPSVTAFDSFSHCIRLLQLMQPSHSANSVVSFSHRSRMCQLNEVDEVVKWSGWVRIMKFMISAQLPIHANGKAKSGLLLPLWFLYENVFLFLLPHLLPLIQLADYKWIMRGSKRYFCCHLMPRIATLFLWGNEMENE